MVLREVPDARRKLGRVGKALEHIRALGNRDHPGGKTFAHRVEVRFGIPMQRPFGSEDEALRIVVAAVEAGGKHDGG